MAAQDDVRAALVAVLREDVGAAAALEAFSAEDVRDAALREGLAPLVAERLTGCREAARVRDALALAARQSTLVEIVRHRALETLLQNLATAGVRTLVFKGEQLAQVCYARPDLRPRLDSDLLVRPPDREVAHDALVASGYQPVPQLEADLISHQRMFVKQAAPGADHVVDLHWRVSNPPEFGDVLPVGELFDAAVRIPGFAAPVEGLGPVHALLVSALHPAAHHAGAYRLMWDLDTARLAAHLPADRWSPFVALAADRGVGAIAHAALQRAVELFRAPVPAEVLAELVRRGGPGRLHAVARSRGSQAAALVRSFFALSGWRDRSAFMRQHLLPPAEYMRRVYAPSSRAPLPLLYLWRAVTGAWKYWHRAG